MEPAGKVALITGGAHRVGKAITLGLAQAGAHVVVNYYSSDKAARETTQEANQFGVEAMAIQCDVADWNSVQRMSAAIQETFGGVDIIVNSASLFDKMPFPTDDLETWKRVTEISIDGSFYVCNALVPAMQTRGDGVIVNIVDLSAWNPWPNHMAHSVGKAALLALTKQLALELAPAIRANAIAPGPVLPGEGTSEESLEKTAQRTLLGRWGRPQDVVDAVLYLVRADFVTGDVMTVDGGERYGHNKRG